MPNVSKTRTRALDRFIECDLELYSALRKILQGNRREVSEIHKSSILAPETAFYEDPKEVQTPPDP